MHATAARWHLATGLRRELATVIFDTNRENLASPESIGIIHVQRPPACVAHALRVSVLVGALGLEEDKTAGQSFDHGCGLGAFLP